MAITRPVLPFEGQFTQIPNAWVRDRRLSRRARGLLTELWSHRPGWRVTIKSLVGAGKEGRDAVLAMVAELRDAGYLVRVQHRAERGKFGEVEYVLADPFATATGFSGHGEPAATGSAGTGLSGSGESAPKNTIDQEHDLSEHQDQDSSSSVTEVDTGASDDDESYPQAPPHLVDMARVRKHIDAMCGRQIEDGVAFGIIGTILERAKTFPANPTAYVLTAITRDPVGWQNYTDTGKAPR